MSIDKLVVACILGDGHVTKNGRIMLQHSSAQEDLLEFKRSILQGFGFKTRKYNYKSLSYGEAREFVKADGFASTKSKLLRSILYPDGFKIAPKEYTENFGFLEWAILYMDDGRQNKISHTNNLINGVRVRKECVPFVNRYEICTESFDENSQENLMSSLYSLGIESTLDKRNRIIIRKSKSKVVFYEGISRYLIPAMQYKISATPSLSYISQ